MRQEFHRAQFWVLYYFLIYIDDVTYGPFSPGTRIVLYADDILLYRTILSNSDYSYLQSDANTVQDWVNCNHMSLNPSKCKFMLISRKCNRINNPPMITINGQILESVPTFKYLGLLLTSDLSWSKHIEGACTKAKKILGLLYRRFYQHADQDTLRQLYISIVRPHMEYAAPVWGTQKISVITASKKKKAKSEPSSRDNSSKKQGT